MKTSSISIDSRVANALVSRCVEEQWPVHIQRGIPFQSENGNYIVDFTVEYLDEFPFEDKLNETINRVFNLTENKK